MALEHKHLIIRSKIKKPPQGDIEFIEGWMAKLVDDIGMKILRGPFAVYSDMEGNRGLTVVTIIETSHIAMHVWDEDDPALLQLDVYTCSHLEPQIVFDAIEQFEPVDTCFYYLDRDAQSAIDTVKKGDYF